MPCIKYQDFKFTSATVELMRNYYQEHDRRGSVASIRGMYGALEALMERFEFLPRRPV